MADNRCPGQDMRYWKPEDIFTSPCPYCGILIEFWKDEPVAVCTGCQKEVRNPRIQQGCASHCTHSEQCTGKSDPNKPGDADSVPK